MCYIKLADTLFVMEETIALIVYITYNKTIEKIWKINL